mmetsp:Transcript_8067/g.19686  ORF Transcript_8067/g.19686 Transcript_8067/m.19686 type:complete len:322 (+) Transcript_8067:30-995(+)
MFSTTMKGILLTVACFQAAAAFAPAALPCLRQTSSVGQRGPATCARPLVAHRRALGAGVLAVRAQGGEEVKEVVSQLLETLDPTKEEKEAVSQLLQLCAVTARGRSSTASQRSRIDAAISAIEASLPSDASPASDPLLNGEWDLVYGSETLTRASPFFSAFRNALSGVSQPFPILPGAMSEAFFAITDGLPFQTVGRVVQTFSDVGSANATLVSAVQVTIRIFDALIPPQDGFVTTTSSYRPTGGSTGVLQVEKTEVKQSSWAQIPGLSAIETTAFPTRDALERVKPGSSDVRIETTFLSPELRITRSSNPAQVWVWARAH